MIQLVLPYPPSVNSYWRHPTTGKLAGRHLISQEGRTYRALVHKVIAWQYKLSPIPGGSDLAVTLTAYMPDRRRRDLDNILKALLDSIVHAGLIDDDSSIVELHLLKGGVRKGGECHVSIEVKERK